MKTADMNALNKKCFNSFMKIYFILLITDG